MDIFKREVAPTISVDNNAFSTSLSDLERVQLLLHGKTIHHDIEKSSKSDARSCQLRTEGNHHLSKGYMVAALDYYTEALFYAASLQEAALAHGNRSQVLFELNFVEYCLNEIEEAIKSGFPKDRLYRLFVRAGECLQRLGKVAEAQTRLSEALLNLSDASELSPTQMASWRRRIEVALSGKSSGGQCRRIICNRPSPLQLADGTYLKEVPAASVSLRLTDIPGAGRGFVAARDIEIGEPGETVVVEEPYCSRLSRACFRTHCYNCYIRCLTLKPCRGCALVGFCSEACASSAWSLPTKKSTGYGVGHRFECPVMDCILKTELGKMAQLAYGVVARTPLDEVCAAVQMGSDWWGRRKVGDVYESRDYACAFSIVSNSDQRSEEDLERRTWTAVFLMLCLKSTGYFSADWGTPVKNLDDSASVEEFVAAALLTHLQALPCNAHNIDELVVPLQGSIENPSSPIELASALYPTLSLLNHSCDPNVVRISLMGNRCAVRTLQPIKAGQELLDNYSMHYAVVSLAERTRVLRRQYFFTCRCLPCTEDWTTFSARSDGIQTIRYKCSDCSSVLSYFGLEKCPACGVSLITAWSSLSRCRREFPEKMIAGLSGHWEEAFEKLTVDYLKLLHSLVFKPCIEFDQALETLKILWSLRGNVFHDFV